MSEWKRETLTDLIRDTIVGDDDDRKTDVRATAVRATDIMDTVVFEGTGHGDLQDEEDIREAMEGAAAADSGDEIYEERVLPTQDELLAARIEERRRATRRRKKRRRRLTLLAMLLTFVMLLTMCGREIIRLKAENVSLRRQQQELKDERDRLSVELKNVGNKDYIKQQARKQLRLLDPGEILFIFNEDPQEEEAAGAPDEEPAEEPAKE